LNDAGTVVLQAALAQSFAKQTLWAGQPGHLAVVVSAHDYQQRPYTTFINNQGTIGYSEGFGNYGGVTFGVGTPGDMQSRQNYDSLGGINDSDQIVVWNPYGIPEDFSVDVGTIDNLQVLARTGEQVPGTPSDTVFSPGGSGDGPFSTPDINATGQAAFIARVAGVSLGGFFYGAWMGEPGNLQLLTLRGDQAPGLPVGVTGALFNTSPLLLNAHGEVVLGAFLEGPGIDVTNDEVLWIGTLGNLHLLVRSGDQAPGAPPGLTFDLSALASGRFPLSINEAGQVVFQSSLRGFDYFGGLWGTDRAGTLREIVRNGDVLQVAPGDFRTVAGISFLGGSGNSDGRPSGFSDNGQVAFWASFTDGSSGVFVSDALTVPEPGTLALGLLACALAGLSIMTRQRKKPSAASTKRPDCRMRCG